MQPKYLPKLISGGKPYYFYTLKIMKYSSRKLLKYLEKEKECMFQYYNITFRGIPFQRNSNLLKMWPNIPSFYPNNTSFWVCKCLLFSKIVGYTHSALRKFTLLNVLSSQRHSQKHKVPVYYTSTITCLFNCQTILYTGFCTQLQCPLHRSL